MGGGARALLVLVAAIQVAVPGESTGWTRSEIGTSCDDACSVRPQLSAEDGNARIRAVDSIDSFSFANRAIISSGSAGFDCAFYADGQSPPTISEVVGPAAIALSQSCYWTSGSTAVEHTQSTDAARLCCCHDTAETAAHACPLPGDSCFQSNEVLDSTLGICMHPLLHSWVYEPHRYSGSVLAVDSVGSLVASAIGAVAWGTEGWSMGGGSTGASAGVAYIALDSVDDLSGDVSIEVVIKIDAASSGAIVGMPIFDCGENDAAGSSNIILSVLPASGYLQIAVGPAHTLVSSIPLPQNAWTHVVATISGSGAKLFINGVSVGPASSAFIGVPPGSRAVCRIGRSSSLTSVFRGEVRLLKLFSGRLTEAMITVLRRSAMPVATVIQGYDFRTDFTGSPSRGWAMDVARTSRATRQHRYAMIRGVARATNGVGLEGVRFQSSVYVQIAGGIDDLGAGARTITMYFKSPDETLPFRSTYYLFSCSSEVASTANTDAVNIFFDSDGALRANHYDNSGLLRASATTPAGAIQRNTWHFVTAVFSPTAGLAVSVDAGTLHSDTTLNAPVSAVPRPACFIGADHSINSISKPFMPSGSVALFEIFGGELRQERIQSLHFLRKHTRRAVVLNERYAITSKTLEIPSSNADPSAAEQAAFTAIALGMCLSDFGPAWVIADFTAADELTTSLELEGAMPSALQVDTPRLWLTKDDAFYESSATLGGSQKNRFYYIDRSPPSGTTGHPQVAQSPWTLMAGSGTFRVLCRNADVGPIAVDFNYRDRSSNTAVAVDRAGGVVTAALGSGARTATGVTLNLGSVPNDAFVAIGDAQQPVLVGGALTIAMIIKEKVHVDGASVLWCSGDATTRDSLIVEIGADHALKFTVQYGVAEFAISSGINAISALTRSHVVTSIDGLKMCLFVNGIELKCEDLVLNPADWNPKVIPRTACYHGKATLAGSAGFKGEISLLRMYLGPTDQTSIAEMYARDFPFLEHQWDFRKPATPSPATIDDSIASVKATITYSGSAPPPEAQTLTGVNVAQDLFISLATLQIGGASTFELVLMWQSFSARSVLSFSDSVGEHHFSFGNDGATKELTVSYRESTATQLLKTVGAPMEVAVRYHIVVVVQESLLGLFVNGREIMIVTQLAVPQPAVVNRPLCFLGKSWDDVAMDGEITSLKVYSGGMNAAQAKAAYEQSFLVLEHSWDFSTTANNPPNFPKNYADLIGSGGDAISALGVVDATSSAPYAAFSGGAMSYIGITSMATKTGGPMTIETQVRFDGTDSDGNVFACHSGSNNNLLTVRIVNGKLEAELDASTLTKRDGRYATSLNALALNVWTDIVVTFDYPPHGISIYIDGIKVGHNAAAAVPTSASRDMCSVGDGGLNGAMKDLKLYSGALRFRDSTSTAAPPPPVSGPSMAPTASLAPTSSPVTSTPTLAPVTGAPNSAAPTEPTSAPTGAPTNMLGALVSMAESPLYASEYSDTPFTLLTVNDAAAATTLWVGERAAILCVARSDFATLSPVNGLAVTLGGATPMGSIVATLVDDAEQHAFRTGKVNCSVRAEGRITQHFQSIIRVAGVAQPSYRSICPVDESGEVNRQGCDTKLTTAGNATIAIIGGICAACPQPPFHATTTVVIGGVPVAARVTDGGTRLLTRTPSMHEILASRGAAREVSDSDFGQYYSLEITTPPGEQGEAGGSVAWGPLAPRSSSDASRLACNPLPSRTGRAFCPDVALKDSGVYYTKLCDGFLNPDLGGWDEPSDSEKPSLFAYGFPPNCVACPFGCRCPGGPRCHAAPGFVADSDGGDALGDAKAPIPCHPDRAISLLRCAGWSDSAGATTCKAGYTGELCASCASGFYGVAGGICELCPTEANAWILVLTISAALAIIFIVSFALVAVVQLSFGRSIGSGAIRSTRFAGWTVAILATQSQIGRTRTGKQPPMLEFWFEFLKIFEANPDGVRPSQCSGSTNSVAVLAMVTSLACVVVFALLGVPILGRAMSKLCTVACNATVALIKRGATKAQRAARGADEDDAPALSSAASSAIAVHFGEEPSKAATSAVVTGVRANPMMLRRAQVKSKAMQAALGDGAIELTELRKLKSSARLIVKGKALASDGSCFASEGEGSGTDHAFAGAALGGVAERDFRPKRGVLQLSEKDAMRAMVVRFHAEREDAATSEGRGRRTCCARKKRKSKTQTLAEKAAAGPARKKASPGARCVGITRKMLGGTIIILHPLVANVAFRHVYCVQKPGSGEHGRAKITVLATDLSQRCFDEKHFAVWALAWATIIVCIVGFPLLVLLSLSRSAGWWRCQCKPDAVELRPPPLPPGSSDADVNADVNANVNMNTDLELTPADGSRPKRPSARASFFGNALTVMAYGRFDPDGTMAAAEAAEKARNAPPQIGSPGYEDWPGPVHGGLCCRCARCVRCLERSRNSFKTVHESSVHPARAQAWTGFTKGDYRPEHFWVRLVFYCSITLLSFSNAFLNPDYLVSASQSSDLGADTGGTAAGANAKAAIVVMQLARFALCGVALFVPCAVLVLVVPNKNGSRWKLPLRLLCALVSFSMLGLNLLSYTVQSAAPLRAPAAPRTTGGALFNATTSPSGGTGVATSSSLRERTDAMIFADNLAYVVLSMSWILLIAMAVFFVIFVVFRGAENQTLNEEASAERRAEEAVVDAARQYLARRRLRRVVSGWRTRVDTAAAEGAQRGADRPRFRASKVAAFAAAATASPPPRAQGRSSFVPLQAVRRSIFAGVRSAIQTFAYLQHPTLPIGWGSHHDGEGAAFYFCDGTDERSCDTPVAGPDGWLGLTSARGGSVVWSHAATQRKQRGSMPDALPEGWSAVLDGSSGRIFYHNEVSDETTWEVPPPLPEGWALRRPAEAPHCCEYYHSRTGRTSAMVPPQLLSGWAEMVDEKTGQVFYVHATSGESRWDAPLAAYGATNAQDTHDASALPAGWEAHREAEGRVFYLNTRSGVTQWTHPGDGMSALEEEEEEDDAVPVVEEESAEEIVIPGRKRSAGSRFSGNLLKILQHPSTRASRTRSKGHKRGKSGRSQSKKQLERTRREVRDMSSRKFVNMMSAWKKRGAASLSDALLGRTHVGESARGSRGESTFRGRALSAGGGGTTENTAEGAAAEPLLCPPLLKYLFSELFVAADLDMDGTLSTIELTNILRRRAGGTDLEGNASAMFKLRTLLASQGCVHTSHCCALQCRTSVALSLVRSFARSHSSRTLTRYFPSLHAYISARTCSHHGEITKAEFQKGLLVAISREPNGPAAQWIMIELMDESARWAQSASGGEAPYWTHPTHGRSASKPEIVSEVERCYTVLGVGE